MFGSLIGIKIVNILCFPCHSLKLLIWVFQAKVEFLNSLTMSHNFLAHLMHWTTYTQAPTLRLSLPTVNQLLALWSQVEFLRFVPWLSSAEMCSLLAHQTQVQCEIGMSSCVSRQDPLFNVTVLRRYWEPIDLVYSETTRTKYTSLPCKSYVFSLL